MSHSLEIVEVAPRDGFQSIGAPIPTQEKIEIIEGLIDAGVPRVEIGSFVSPRAVPQMADMADIAAHFREEHRSRLSVLVPNVKGVDLALTSGLREVVYVFSISEAHNQNNVRCSVEQSIAGLADVISTISNDPDVSLRVDLATAFDCPFDGPVPFDDLQVAIGKVLDLAPNCEIALCDTTGWAPPFNVKKRFDAVMQMSEPQPQAWAFHGHDTYGMGVANAFAAYQSGVRVFDTSAAGLGGCPFAPGAAGNTATEDLVHAFRSPGPTTGIDLMKLLEIVDRISPIPEAVVASHLANVRRDRLRKVQNL
ncbi:(R)-citramalyl-CoA lyase [Sulfitobacter sp. DSM 110093]|nr:(R)-citramalyl-CoA lyase [Sulfitobacter sp. DSM 110093]